MMGLADCYSLFVQVVRKKENFAMQAQVGSAEALIRADWLLFRRWDMDQGSAVQLLLAAVTDAKPRMPWLPPQAFSAPGNALVETRALREEAMTLKREKAIAEQKEAEVRRAPALQASQS